MPKVRAGVKAKKAITKKSIKKPIIKKSVHSRAKKKVSPIPKGYHSITPYLIVDGAAKAIAFYQKAFGAKIGMKMERPNGKRITHSELKIGDAKIMLADECSEMNAHGPKAFGGSPMSIHLYVKNVDKIVKQAVAAGAKLLRPVENMFYGDRCGRIEDPYGYQWHVSTHVENVPMRELKKRIAKLFGAL